MLYEKNGAALETAVGFSPGSLKNGWKLFTPRLPLEATDIDLQASTRYSNGLMPDGRRIAEVLAARTDVAAARVKVASFFDRGLDRRPVKVMPNSKPTAYPSAPGVGLPQFKLLRRVEWVFVLEVAPGSALTRAAAATARW
jgi:hypothetical protein